jgi:hypothetical protein
MKHQKKKYVIWCDKHSVLFRCNKNCDKAQLFLKQALAKERASATDLKKKMENKGK